VERSRATLGILVFGGLTAGAFTVLFLGMRSVTWKPRSRST